MDPETSTITREKKPILKLLTEPENGLPHQQTRSFSCFFGNIHPIYSEVQFCLDQNGAIVDCTNGDCAGLCMPSTEFLGHTIFEILPAPVCVSLLEPFAKSLEPGQITTFEYDLKIGDEIFWHAASYYLSNPSNLIVIIRDVTEQTKMNRLAHRHQQYMLALQEMANLFAGEVDSQLMAQHILHACVDQIGASGAWLGWLRDGAFVQEQVVTQAGSEQSDLLHQLDITPYELETLLETRTPLINEHSLAQPGVRSFRAFFALASDGHVFGVLGLIAETTDFFSPECVNFFQTYTMLVASTSQHVRLYEKSRRQLSRMETLQIIDQAILSNLDFKSTMAVILQEVAKHIHVDALALLIFDPKTQMLNFLDGFGFHFDTFQHSHLRIGDGFAGQVVQEKRIVQIHNLQQNPQSFSRSTNFKAEGFMMYLGIPLIARAEVKGVLEIFKREPFEPTADWLAFLETLANQIAIAIDNSLLVKFLQDSNNELTVAYNATIEGLSQALELRDRETEGHTRRVAEMTASLALKMGFSEEEVMQIRQGALLHDIGKMGIPDAILLKPGALTADEWETMRKHPIYAHQLLSKVEHLKFGIDIPLYHHEKYSGAGYPYGLKGDQIPFSARMFAFADVFDALTSDRPYRTAWTKEKTLTYIRSQVGIHFDPAILPAFEELVQ